MNNIDVMLVQALPDKQILAATLAWLVQTLCSGVEWRDGEDISPKTLTSGFDMLNYLIPVLNRAVLYMRSPQVENIVKLLNDKDNEIGDLVDAGFELRQEYDVLGKECDHLQKVIDGLRNEVKQVRQDRNNWMLQAKRAEKQ